MDDALENLKKLVTTIEQMNKVILEHNEQLKAIWNAINDIDRRLPNEV